MLSVTPFADYDNDGVRDLVAGVVVDYLNWPVAYGANRVLSGRDGSTLLAAGTRGMVFRSVGDMNQDGLPELASVAPAPFYGQAAASITSFPSYQVLWAAYGPLYNQFAIMADDTTLMTGYADLTGDGVSDFVVATYDSNVPAVQAYSSTGAPLYSLPMLQLGWVPRCVAPMPDLDNDGASEFLVGVLESTGRGAVVVISGLTGAIHRISYGLRVGDVIGGAVCNAGDVDRDGVTDYAAASFTFSPLLSIVIFSGQTGSVIRSWTDYWTQSGGLLGDIDVDIDGVPDLIVANGGYQISPTTWGQVRAYSGRDGSVLWAINATSANDPIQPEELINLGTRPGDPYPLLAFLETGWREFNATGQSVAYHRVLTYRTNLPGAGPVTGAPCSSTTTTPRIGMRHVGAGGRITVCDGAPGALALLVGGPAAQTTFDGIALPFSLDSFGLFGCHAYVAPVVAVPSVLGTAGIDRGYAAVDIPWRLGYTGIALAAQWLILDVATGNYAMTPRHDFRTP